MPPKTEAELKKPLADFYEEFDEGMMAFFKAGNAVKSFEMAETNLMFADLPLLYRARSLLVLSFQSNEFAVQRAQEAVRLLDQEIRQHCVELTCPFPQIQYETACEVLATAQAQAQAASSTESELPSSISTRATDAMSDIEMESAATPTPTPKRGVLTLEMFSPLATPESPKQMTASRIKIRSARDGAFTSKKLARPTLTLSPATSQPGSPHKGPLSPLVQGRTHSQKELSFLTASGSTVGPPSPSLPATPTGTLGRLSLVTPTSIQGSVKSWAEVAKEGSLRAQKK